MKVYPEPRDPLVGTLLDERYRIIGVLGRGGMGVVYDGVHELLGRSVAIKVLGAGIADSEVAVQRFLREARTASGLTHGNIVDVSDLGRTPDGRPYLVMAKMAGEDLSALLFRLGPQTPARVTDLLRGVAAALDLIHAKGYVHRDIKPENLMHVIREDGSEAVMVLDFGIVGLVSGKKASRLTAEGSVFGTPAYLPPEVIEGDTMDPRGDVYALATCAFELMTGHLPYDAENPVRILPMKMMKDPPRMSAVCEVVFHDAIEAAISKGLARKLEDRHQTSGAFISALDAAVKIAGQQPLPRPSGRPPPDISPTSKLMRLPHTSELDLDSDEGAWDGATTVTKNDGHGEASLSEAPTNTTENPVLTRGRRNRAFALFGVGACALALVLWLSLRSSAPEPDVHAVTQLAEPPKPTPEASPPPTAPAVPTAVVQAPTPVAAPTAAPAPSVAPAVRKPIAARVPAAPRPTPSAPAPQATVKPLPTPVAAPVDNASGQSAADLNKSAMQALMQGHAALAAELYTRASHVDPRNEAAFRGLGLASEKLGKKQDAARAFRHALDIAPNGPQAESIRSRLQALETP